jgi:hypothetical protein
MDPRSLVALLLSLCISSSAVAQDAKLIEAAKKEAGKVVAYGSLAGEFVTLKKI